MSIWLLSVKADPGHLFVGQWSSVLLCSHLDGNRLGVFRFFGYRLAINAQAFNIGLNGFLGAGDGFLYSFPLGKASRKSRNRYPVDA